MFVAAGLFVVTNVDTLLVLVAFCLDEDYHPVEILAGHAIGFLIGIAAAILGAILAAEFLEEWTFLLGVLPLALGLWGLAPHASEAEGDELQVVPGPTGRITVVGLAAIGLNGENLVVYIPFFARLTGDQLLVVSMMYLIGAGIVFLAADTVARTSAAWRQPAWINRWLVPGVLIVVGVYVLVSGWLAV